MSDTVASQDRFLRRLAVHRNSVEPSKRDRFDKKIGEIEALTGRVNVAVSQLMQMTSKSVKEQVGEELKSEKKKFNPDAPDSQLTENQEAMMERLAGNRGSVAEVDLPEFDDVVELIRAYSRRINAAVAHLAYLSTKGAH